jgi:plastocyanin
MSAMRFSSVLRCVAFVGALFALPLQAANHDVHLGGSGMAFTPGDLAIDVGDTVTFINDGGTHNVVADDRSFRCAEGCDPVTMQESRGTGTDGYCGPYGGYCPPVGKPGDPSSAGWRVTLPFNAAGTVGYHCEVHGRAGGGMFGRVVVRAAAPSFTVPPAITGNWYDPAQNGHGVQLEMVGNNVVTAIWFTYDNAGNLAWIVGSGTVDGNRLVMQAVRPRGGRFPPNFDPSTFTAPPWGTLTFTFGDCNSGRLDWTSTDPAFTAAGSMPLARLTQIQGSACQ